MNLIRHISLQYLLTLILVLIFILSWSLLTWKEYQNLQLELIKSSIDSIKHDLGSLQLEVEYQDKHIRERAISRRGVNTKYQVLALIDDMAKIMHGIKLAQKNRLAFEVYPNFNMKHFADIQKTHKINISLDIKQQFIIAYFPLTLERDSHIIRSTNTGVLYAVYSLKEGKSKIINSVINSAIQIGTLLLGVMLLLFLLVNVYVTKPIHQLLSLTIELSKGQLGVKKQINGTKEFVKLAESFNQMSQSLSQRFKERQQAEEKLKLHKEQLEELVEERTKELTQANIDLKHLSEIDPLTTLYNRRMYESYLIKCVLLAKRNAQPLSMMIIDIDYFKAYNDHYGHDAGDITLKKVAQTIKQSTPRKTDMVARYGGEEFIVLMPSTDEQGAFILAENIRKKIQFVSINHNYSKVAKMVTVSIGISSLHGDAVNEKDLFKQADIALYTVKETGRNNSKVYSKSLL
ncbi:MAG: diguanylate cyclase [Gammaproteobacteria bacterium]|nr:diguanylate cyclase [Gammaproteobacteria bacterium]